MLYNNSEMIVLFASLLITSYFTYKDFIYKSYDYHF